jgi:hypothetical protein
MLPKQEQLVCKLAGPATESLGLLVVSNSRYGVLAEAKMTLFLLLIWTVADLLQCLQTVALCILADCFMQHDKNEEGLKYFLPLAHR